MELSFVMKAHDKFLDAALRMARILNFVHWFLSEKLQNVPRTECVPVHR